MHTLRSSVAGWCHPKNLPPASRRARGNHEPPNRSSSGKAVRGIPRGASPAAAPSRSNAAAASLRARPDRRTAPLATAPQSTRGEARQRAMWPSADIPVRLPRPCSRRGAPTGCPARGTPAAEPWTARSSPRPGLALSCSAVPAPRLPPAPRARAARRRRSPRRRGPDPRPSGPARFSARGRSGPPEELRKGRRDRRSQHA
mmetsp:Transcript_168955/g.543174  ORF Transcript_168955/g.543174 Transcript_168955/m.543174 type:complete len:201 (-) Transcript_168955:101-703(-)